MGGAKLNHLAGPHEEHPLIADPLEDPLGKMYRGSGHGHDVGADRRGGSHLLGHREGALEELVHGCPKRAGLFGLAHRILHLAEDLGLADHHGIKPAGHPEHVPHGVPLGQGVQIR